MRTCDSRSERLLEWMRDGDASRVPVMMCSGHDLAASLYGVPSSEVTWEMATQAAEETGTYSLAYVGSPTCFLAIEFSDELSLEHHAETLPDGSRQETAVLTTPAGSLRKVNVQQPGIGAVNKEFFIKDEKDLPVVESFWRIAFRTVKESPAVCQHHYNDMKSWKDTIGDAFPIAVHPFCPAVALLCSMYHDQQTAIYLLHDYRELFEEIFELHWEMTSRCLEEAARLDVDIYNFAINGLEWLSPDLYERYMIPQARRIAEFAEAHGKLSWIHTCGKKHGLVERDVYRRMGVSVIESLSAPPTGDIDDYQWARSRMGPDVVTRGGMNCELFYERDAAAFKAHAHKVLDGCAGYRHMIGDTNSSVPPYDLDMIQTLTDVVRERGAAFE